MIEKNVDYRVKGYIGFWGVCDEARGYVMLEHCTLGDETCYLVVRKDLKVHQKTYTKKSTGEKVVLPTLQPRKPIETFDNIEIALTDEGLI